MLITDKIRIRKGLTSCEGTYYYVTGYVVNADLRTAIYQGGVQDNLRISVKDIDSSDIYNISCNVNFNINIGDYVTLFLVDGETEGSVVPVAIFNHETDKIMISNNDISFIGKSLLKYNIVKRFISKSLRFVEFITSILINYQLISIFLPQSLLSLFLSLVLTPITVFIIQKITSLIFPSYYTIIRAYKIFKKQCLLIGRKEALSYKNVNEDKVELKDEISNEKFINKVIDNETQEEIEDNYKPMF